MRIDVAKLPQFSEIGPLMSPANAAKRSTDDAKSTFDNVAAPVATRDA